MGRITKISFCCAYMSLEQKPIIWAKSTVHLQNKVTSYVRFVIENLFSHFNFQNKSTEQHTFIPKLMLETAKTESMATIFLGRHDTQTHQ